MYFYSYLLSSTDVMRKHLLWRKLIKQIFTSNKQFFLSALHIANLLYCGRNKTRSLCINDYVRYHMNTPNKRTSSNPINSFLPSDY